MGREWSVEWSQSLPALDPGTSVVCPQQSAQKARCLACRIPASHDQRGVTENIFLNHKSVCSVTVGQNAREQEGDEEQEEERKGEQRHGKRHGEEVQPEKGRERHGHRTQQATEAKRRRKDTKGENGRAKGVAESEKGQDKRRESLGGERRN